jgi:hypothetical protein
LLYFALTGKPPFKGQPRLITATAVDIIQGRRSDLLTDRCDLPEQLKWTVTRALSANINERFETLSEFQNSLTS